jgi:hypothetical protein
MGVMKADASGCDRAITSSEVDLLSHAATCT